MDNFAEIKMAESPQPATADAAPPVVGNKSWEIWLFAFWRLFRHFWMAVALAAWGWISYLLITHFIFLSVRVDGSSMYPTLENSGKYWLNRLAYFRSEPQRRDIVVLKDPRDGVLVVKRIIALPGESVYFKKGKVYLDGKLLNEPYLPEFSYTFAYQKKSGDEFVCVGKNEYFVMGDNRSNSTDSRTYGTVPRDKILGKLFSQ